MIPAYNRGYILAQALESVFSQTYSDYEVIVVDDGSTDNTREVLQRFKEPRLRLICHSENRGCGAAYNTGFSAAVGEFISILDSDDLWKPQKLEYDVRFLDDHSDAGAVFSDLEKTDGDQFISSFIRAHSVFARRLKEGPFPEGILLTQREMYLCLLQEVPIKPSTVTLRRYAMQEVGFFDESQPSANDWDFFLRFACAYRWGYIDRSMTVARLQPDATHRVHAEKNYQYALDFLRRRRELARGDEEALAALRYGIADNFKHLSWHYLAIGRKVDAARSLYHGYRETGSYDLLSRAVGALFPGWMRRRLKQLARRQGN